MITHLSYSSISTFIDCARKWKFKYIERLPEDSSPALAFGSAFHSTIEASIRRISLDQGVAYGEMWEHYLQEHVGKMDAVMPVTPEEYAELLENGFMMLDDDGVMDFVQNFKPLMLHGEPAVEQRIEIRVPGVPVPIVGYIDLVDENNIPYDLKTAAASWPKDRAAGELQPLFYLAALADAGNPSPGNTFKHVVFPKAGKNRIQIFEHQHTQAEIDWLFDAIREYWMLMQAGVFSPNPNSTLCNPKYCSFWNLCRGKK